MQEYLHMEQVCYADVARCPTRVDPLNQPTRSSLKTLTLCNVQRWPDNVVSPFNVFLQRVALKLPKCTCCLPRNLSGPSMLGNLSFDSTHFIPSISMLLLCWKCCLELSSSFASMRKIYLEMFNFLLVTTIWKCCSPAGCLCIYWHLIDGWTQRWMLNHLHHISYLSLHLALRG